ncbi:MAG: thiamine pyrophosphate-dependent enzyme [Alphaproteobacteria bacterium]|nr:thiamine pyrophosphate-dependent enzyme [Alphaproteobacteria bacterium]
MAARLNGKLRLGLFERMLLIRRFEEMNIEIWPRHSYMGRQHLYIGHEAIAAAVGLATKRGDICNTTHRNHGYVLARGVDPGKALAEILGREGGTNGGRGGPWHISDKAHGFLTTSAQLGGGLALGVGAGFGLKGKRGKRVSVVHFGDGTMPEGLVYESFNMASVLALPVLFVCENNAIPERGGLLAVKHWDDVPRALSIHCEPPVDGNDAGAVYAVVDKALARIRRTGKPVFIQPNVKAWPGSHKAVPEYTTGVTDLAMAWDAKRAKGPNADWNRTDPVLRMARVLLRAKQATRGDIEAVDAKIGRRLKAALAYAEASPFPKPRSALRGVYA